MDKFGVGGLNTPTPGSADPPEELDGGQEGAGSLAVSFVLGELQYNPKRFGCQWLGRLTFPLADL